MKTEEILTNCIYKLLDQDLTFFSMETEYTKHYFEKVSRTAHDRGKWKWHVENNENYYENVASDEIARECHIDDADLFPRYYFFEECMTKEFLEWLRIRKQHIKKVNNPLH